MHLQPRNVGDFPNLTADELNAMLEVAREWRRGHIPRKNAGATSGPDDKHTPASMVRIVNGTGSTLPVHAIVTPSSAFTDPATDPLPARRKPAVTAVAPTASTDSVLVLLDSVGDGRVGWAVAAGVTVVQVAVSNASHRYARPIAGNVFQLESAETGPAYLLTPPGVGTAKTYVLLGRPEPTPAEEAAEDCTGCGWVVALKDTDCLKVSVVTATGDCACADGTEPIYLSSVDGEVWGDSPTSPGGGGTEGCDSLPDDGFVYGLTASGGCLLYPNTPITLIAPGEWATVGTGGFGGGEAHVTWDGVTFAAWIDDTTPQLDGLLISSDCDFVDGEGNHWAFATFDFTASGDPCTGTFRLAFGWQTS